MKLFGLVILLVLANTTYAVDCGQEVIDNILAQADETNHTVSVGCSMKVPNPNVTITKKLVFEGKKGSNVTFDCNGATINSFNKGGYNVAIKSKKLGGGIWEPAENVTVKNCIIYGDVRVWGIGTNGQGEDLLPLSRKADFTKVAQKNAPRNITLDKLKVIAEGGSPIYIAPGVTYVTLSNSEFTGRSTSVAVYLDMESAYNTIKNNRFHVDSGRREQLAIDGSAHNTITGNFFAHLNEGGIFLYRNCGEGGVIRHQTPSYNKIIGNTFYYKNYRGLKQAVNVASRNGLRLYCWRDSGYPYGSSANNRDLARYNEIAHNQFVNRNPEDYISINEKPNYVHDNVRVSPEY